MDRSLNLVLRWGMAGWCLIVELGVFVATYKLFLAGNKPFELLDGRIPVVADSGLMTAILAAVGVPLGYFIYQFYYFLFWTVPLNRSDPPEAQLIRRLIERCGRERQLDKELQALYESWADTVCLSRWRADKDKWWVNLVGRLFSRGKRSTRDVMAFRNAWALSRAAWLKSLARGGGPDDVGTLLAGDRFEYLTSMFDGLGAVMIANWIAFVALLVFDIWRLAFVDGFGGEYVLRMGASHPSVSAVSAIGTMLLLQVGVCYVFHRMIWVNRVYFRMSLVTLMDSFICHFGCESPTCLDEENEHGKKHHH